MSIKMVHVGFHHFINAERIIAIAAPNSTPVKRNIQDAKESKVLVDLTSGRRTKAVIFTASRHVILSALEPVTISGRIDGTTSG